MWSDESKQYHCLAFYAFYRMDIFNLLFGIVNFKDNRIDNNHHSTTIELFAMEWKVMVWIGNHQEPDLLLTFNIFNGNLSVFSHFGRRCIKIHLRNDFELWNVIVCKWLRPPIGILVLDIHQVELHRCNGSLLESRTFASVIHRLLCYFSW